MSISVSLANFIVAKLKADPVVASFVGDRIWDEAPADREFPNITLGPTDFTVEDADCIDMREETLQLDIWTNANGRKWPCKQIVDAVVNVLRHAEGDLADGALVDMRITIARVLDDPDGTLAHGVVQATAIIEE